MTLAAASLFFPSPSSSSFLFSHKPSLSLHLRIPFSTLSLSPNYPIIPQTRFPNSKLRLLRFSSAAEQVVQVEADAQEETQSQNQEEEEEKRRKLFVFNLPWSFSAPDITNLFSQCGVVKHVEVIRLLLLISPFFFNIYISVLGFAWILNFLDVMMFSFEI